MIKVGGSLLDWPELPARLANYLARYRTEEPLLGGRVVLMAGGGRAVDVVRALDRTLELGDARAHLLAIRALDWTAELLGALLPGAVVVRRQEGFRSVWNTRRLPVLAPAQLVHEIEGRSTDPLPASWDVTSDSIVARIAVHLGASRLILLKSRPLPRGARIEEAVRIGLVDPHFPRAASGLDAIAMVCLRDPGPPLRAMTPEPHGQ
jgi:aspartokinase-like uncharacterized kinase